MKVYYILGINHLHAYMHIEIITQNVLHILLKLYFLMTWKVVYIYFERWSNFPGSCSLPVAKPRLNLLQSYSRASAVYCFATLLVIVRRSVWASFKVKGSRWASNQLLPSTGEILSAGITTYVTVACNLILKGKWARMKIVLSTSLLFSYWTELVMVYLSPNFYWVIFPTTTADVAFW